MFLPISHLGKKAQLAASVNFIDVNTVFEVEANPTGFQRDDKINTKTVLGVISKQNSSLTPMSQKWIHKQDSSNESPANSRSRTTWTAREGMPRSLGFDVFSLEDYHIL